MQRIKITIDTDYIKLDSLLKLANLADSGGMAKEIIQEGLVYLNDKPCLMRGKKIRPGDQVKLEDYLIEVGSE